MRSMVLGFSAVFVLSVCACDGGGGGGGGGDDEESVYIDDAGVTCDPTASAWDDLFVFEAWTSGPVEDVYVDIWNGSSSEGSVDLDERTSGTWYAEAWGDDIDSDCDDWNYMSFEFTAEGDEDSDSATVQP